MKLDELQQNRTLSEVDYLLLLTNNTQESRDYAAALAREVRHLHYGHKVFVRGLIEISNICRNDCLYCGIRKGNQKCSRYRLTEDVILDCCRRGYELGFRTFVLQGGEDGYFTDSRLEVLLREMKQQYPDCAITFVDENRLSAMWNNGGMIFEEKREYECIQVKDYPFGGLGANRYEHYCLRV